eukprot:TRINITY_DN8548_c0_g1_i1.p1 TRINITY_DN8548_c0_g1~~TRINITY_DN8548_c0_g1_i1.p1  ORF type:complete len:594 (-),score=111.97 TRINITY_DN8548_c0_g1_i1:61-1842(-)
MSLSMIEKKFQNLDERERNVRHYFSSDRDVNGAKRHRYAMYSAPRLSDELEAYRNSLPARRRYAFQLPDAAVTVSHGFGPVLSNVPVTKLPAPRPRPSTASSIRSSNGAIPAQMIRPTSAKPAATVGWAIRVEGAANGSDEPPTPHSQSPMIRKEVDEDALRSLARPPDLQSDYVGAVTADAWRRIGDEVSQRVDKLRQSIRVADDSQQQQQRPSVPSIRLSVQAPEEAGAAFTTPRDAVISTAATPITAAYRRDRDYDIAAEFEKLGIKSVRRTTHKSRPHSSAHKDSAQSLFLRSMQRPSSASAGLRLSSPGLAVADHLELEATESDFTETQQQSHPQHGILKQPQRKRPQSAHPGSPSGSPTRAAFSTRTRSPTRMVVEGHVAPTSPADKQSRSRPQSAPNRPVTDAADAVAAANKSDAENVITDSPLAADATTRDDDDEQSKPSRPPSAVSQRGEDNPMSKEFYLLKVHVAHKQADVRSWMFDVYITDITDPRQPAMMFKQVRVDRESNIIFHPPTNTTLSPVDDFPFVDKPDDLLDHQLRVEVYGIYPVKTCVVDSVVHYVPPVDPVLPRRAVPPPLRDRSSTANRQL